jgi:ATP-dependent exoDNAse (exonuclease V) alpha subunit
VDFGDITTIVTKDVWKIEETFLGPDGKVKTKTLASREQIPLKLAYAATIHKTQGLTIDKISVDLGGCFAPGQFYTALSRARRLEDLTIVGFSPSSLRTDPRCVEFYNNL